MLVAGAAIVAGCSTTSGGGTAAPAVKRKEISTHRSGTARPLLRALVTASLAALFHFGGAQAAPVERVTLDNYVRAETDRYFSERVNSSGIGRLSHDRQGVDIDHQPVVRMNRDTPYSRVVLDLTTPATLVLPNVGTRFQSAMVINEDHFIKLVIYGPGERTITKEMVERATRSSASGPSSTLTIPKTGSACTRRRTASLSPRPVLAGWTCPTGIRPHATSSAGSCGRWRPSWRAAAACSATSTL